MNNLAGKKEITEPFLKSANTLYEQYKTDREDYDELCKVADAMYECMQNRSIEATERAIGVNTDIEPRAQMGSTIYHRMVKQSSALGAQIINESERPIKFSPIINDDVFESIDEGRSRCSQYDALLKWQMKHDDFRFKNQQFWNQVRKYGNIVVGMGWSRQTKRVAVRGKGGKTTWEERTEEYPSFKIFPHDSVYADRYGGPLSKQKCVIILSLVGYSDLAGESDSFEKKQWEEATEKWKDLAWNQTEGYAFKKSQTENRGLSWSPGTTSQALRWDIYQWSPVDGNEWDEKGVPSTLLWMTSVGNTINTSIPLRLVADFDPDGEMPIKMIHALPDDEDLLYHTTPGQVIRSIYSAVCTFWNLALDNGANINDPKRIVSPDLLHTNDMSKNVWVSSNPNQAMFESRPEDITPNITNLINNLVSEMLSANGWDLNTLGQSFGARTSASEAMNINRQSMIPSLSEVRYVIDQLLPWYGKKFQRYMQAYAPEDMIVAISDHPSISSVEPAKLIGDFDVMVDVVDEYASNITESAALQQFFMAVASNPSLQKSETHQIDMGELLRTVAKRSKLPDAPKFIIPPKGSDSRFAADMENVSLTDGDPATYVAPLPGQIHSIHLSSHKAKRLEYQGLEEQYPVEVEQLDRHIEETNALIEQEQTQQQMVQQQQSMAVPQVRTEGQLAAEPLQEILGPAAGQGPM